MACICRIMLAIFFLSPISFIIFRVSPNCFSSLFLRHGGAAAGGDALPAAAVDQLRVAPLLGVMLLIVASMPLKASSGCPDP